jgi:hypothetical protein
MELVAIDESRVVHLTTVTRPAGQMYLPEVATKLITRYGFAKPPTLDDLLKDVQVFGIGKFDDIAIQELRIYSDGIIASSRSNTAKIEAFISDLFAWAEKEIGLVTAVIAKPEKYYESVLMVKSKVDLAKALAPADAVLLAFQRTWKHSNSIEASFVPSGILLDCDAHKFAGRRKPARISVERRVGFPFEENVFYCGAPVSTNDHLAFLAALEDLAGG